MTALSLKAAVPVAAIMAALASPKADAIDAIRVIFSGPTNYCQAATPVSDGKIRKRPLALVNEGTTPAIVTCSFSIQTNGTSIEKILLAARTQSGQDATLSCTGVSGGEGQALPPAFVVKSVQLDGSGARDDIAWIGTDFNGAFPTRPFSVSCNLLPGMSLLDSSITIKEGIGE